jgi:hypothetical protein
MGSREYVWVDLDVVAYCDVRTSFDGELHLDHVALSSGLELCIVMV